MEDVAEAPHLLVKLRHPEDAGALRRAVAKSAGGAGVAAALLPKAELVATELGTNIVLHAAGGGHVLSRAVGSGDAKGFELIAVDHGPGIDDLQSALDGTGESARGLGCGLAGVRRMATEFDAFTASGRGTVVVARLLTDGSHDAPRWSGVSIPVEGEAECGDAWAVAEEDGVVTALVVDGLGHGPEAAGAAREAVRTFTSAHGATLEALAESIHHAMRSTRGGAVALCRLDPARRRAQIIGIGNIRAQLIDDGGSHAMVSLNGTMGVGLAPPRMRRLDYDLTERATLVMCTDGIRDGFDAAVYPGLLSHDPSVVAAVIHRDNSRVVDDATVVVVRLDGGGEP